MYLGKRDQALKMLALTMIPIVTLLCVVSIQLVDDVATIESRADTKKALDFSVQVRAAITTLVYLSMYISRM